MPTEQKTIRKLRAILSADVKGYSLLMADNELATIATLKSYRQKMTLLIQQHQGRVVDSPGDNILAEFASAVDAVKCSVKIQEELKERNADLSEDRKMQFRIGINIGDVVQDSDRIYGDGVNIAARIEGLTEPGGICISRGVCDHVKKKLKLGFEYLGEHSVKNIAEPVRVYKVLMEPEYAGKLIGEKKKRSKLKWFLAAGMVFVLITAGILFGLFLKFFYLPTPENIDPEDKMSLELPKGPSIAVLPFDNMTGDKELEYFCDGITENVISSLSYIPELFVIARNSTFAYKGKSISVQKIGQELGARYVIEGSIQKAVERIRIIVQLIDTQSGLHKWSETYDREPKDILELQDDIAFEILKAMEVKIKGRGDIRKIAKGINDFHEYKKLLKCVSYFYQFTPESNNLAQVEVLELIDINSNIPRAYAILAHTYIFDIFYDRCDSPLICLGKATEVTRKALSIDSTYDMSHIAAGHIYLIRKEHDKAIDSAKKAIMLNPSNATAYSFLGYVLIYADELEKAIDNIKKAIRFNPIISSNDYFRLGFAYQDAQQFDKAIDAYKKSIAIHPDFWAPYVGMVVVYGHMGDRKKAKEAISELLRIRPTFSKSQFLKTMPFKYEKTRVFIGEGLYKAGLTD